MERQIFRFENGPVVKLFKDGGIAIWNGDTLHQIPKIADEARALAAFHMTVNLLREKLLSSAR